MTSKFLLQVLAFFTLLFSTAQAQTEDFILVESDGGVNELKVSGNIFKSNKGEFVTFSFTIDGESVKYLVRGNTDVKKGYFTSTLDYAPVRIQKQVIENGKPSGKWIENKGTLDVSKRERKAGKNLILAGIPISGKFVQGAVDDGIWFDDLLVGGVKSSGCLNYNSRNGYYNVPSDCQFGGCDLQGSDGGSCVLNYNNFIGQNQFQVQIQLGSLVATGKITFADTEKRTGDATTVTATSGVTNLVIKKADGSVFKLKGDSEDDKAVRMFIAFLELFTFDTFAE